MKKTTQVWPAIAALAFSSVALAGQVAHAPQQQLPSASRQANVRDGSCRSTPRIEKGRNCKLQQGDDTNAPALRPGPVVPVMYPDGVRASGSLTLR